MGEEGLPGAKVWRRHSSPNMPCVKAEKVRE